MSQTTETRKPNRLIHEKSPYLLQHAYNPVDWFPWGNEAFLRARRENKPIFLSIGYSTCHWCHVMERESFENDEVAALMNKYFVCIKLDREERPDIDKIYMTATQATTGGGGWPMSVWLTPDLKPFFCGTYFPPESRYGRPGFKEILQRVHDVWESNKDGIIAQANQITAAIQEQVAVGRGGPPSSAEASAKAEGRPPTDAPMKLGFEQFRGSYDTEHGGFGGAPKFPRPVTLSFLFHYYSRTNDATARDMALHTLRAMAEGGLFDQLGGGFHRYSVDDRWLVSHFEKMLYDQAQLVSSYIDAYQITHDPFFAEVARRTCDYVLRDMTNPEGAFYSAEDADSEGVEGKFYVWTREQIDQVFGGRSESLRSAANQSGSAGAEPSMSPEAIDIFCRYYGVEREGNWEHGNNVLHVTMSLEQASKLFKKPEPEIAAVLDQGRTKLFEARAKRIRPHRDEKILTSWNGLMISALARTSQATGDRRYQNAAERDARYILKYHYKDKRLWRTPTVPAVVDDYAFFANGLLDLYEATYDPQWLKSAMDLTNTMKEMFYDAKDGGFFMTSGQDESVIVRAKEDYDGAEPSGNSVAAMLLLRLAQFTDRAYYREAAEKTLGLFGTHMNRAPHAVPQMLCALDFYLSKPKQIIIAGKPTAADTQAMLRAVYDRYIPNKILMVADDGPWQKELATLLPFIDALKSTDGKATAYLCVDYTCQLPTNDPGKFGQQLDAGPGKQTAKKP